jgi:hypothetical protein
VQAPLEERMIGKVEDPDASGGGATAIPVPTRNVRRLNLDCCSWVAPPSVV